MTNEKILKNIKKRDGRVVPFDALRIENAIFKAFEAQGQPNREIAAKLTQEVVEKLEKKHRRIKAVPAIEEVQDLVEEILVEAGYAKIAKAYILYRERRAEIRREKQEILNKTEIDEVDKKFDINALRVLQNRYLRKDESGKAVESPKELFTRVALQIGLADILYDQKVAKKIKGALPEYKADAGYIPLDQKSAEELSGKLKVGKYALNKFHAVSLHRAFVRMEKWGLAKINWEKLVSLLKQDAFKDYEKNIDEYYELMVSRKFLPNTPTLANFGSSFGMGSACFVLGIDDSMESIMQTLKDTAFIHQAGGGTGFFFGNLRPEGDFVSKTSGQASGPISFMRLYDFLTEVVKQGGMRRGANMGIMPSDHPDIEKFVTAKQGNQALRNFNISILIKPEFWECYEKNKPYPLINPRNGKIIRYISARSLWDRIVYQAWESAEPGVIFYDHLNKYNPFLKSLGPLTATNPCVVGETLVAVADGRNYVSIKQLAKEKKDVPVYCYGNGRVSVRMGRNPRKTRKKVPVWKVVLDDGSHIIATEDHKFRDRDNTEVKLKDLKPGISLMPFYKFQYQPTGKKNPYWGILLNNGDAVAEHRMVAEFHLGRTIKKYPEEVVHHKNFNGLDNTLKNLEILSQSEHDRFHQKGEQNVMKGKWWAKLSEDEKITYRDSMSRALSGVNNPMYGKKHNQETKRLIGLKTKERFRDSNFRKKFSEKIRLLFETTDISRKISEAMTRYEYLNGNCLSCNKKILMKENKIKKFCSRSCQAKEINKNRDKTTVRLKKAEQRDKRREELYMLGLKFFEKNKKIPKYEEFKDFVKQERNLSGDLRSTFGGYNSFKERLLLKNHTIVSVEFYGYRDVYNITVDEFHTVAYVTNPYSQTKISRMPLISGIITSQCGEQPLYPNESCNLGSVNLWAFAKENSGNKKFFDWQDFERTIRIATRFLNNVIDVNNFPLPQIEEMTFNTRKIGLGLMGLGELLFELESPYNSAAGRKLMEKIAEFLNYHSKIESIELAKTRGAFPYYSKSFYPEGKMPFAAYYDRKSWNLDWSEIPVLIKKFGMRNSLTTTIAPSGTISMIAGTSSGIEPVYSLVFQKNTPIGSFYYVDPVFEEAMSREGLFDEVLVKDVVNNKGSIQKIHYIPSKLKKYFLSAYDIKAEDHIYVLAAFSKWIDNAISKTNNLPASAATADVEKSYLLAYKLGIKDVTIYRDESIKNQTLVVETKRKEGKTGEADRLISIKDEKAKGPAIFHSPAGADQGIVSVSQENGEAIVNYQGPQNCPQCQI